MFDEVVKAVFSQSVTIGPEFFAKSFNDYRDQFWAFAREILQNSLDCGSTRIEVRLQEILDPPDGVRDRTVVVVTNNGTPMTREILVDKLLSLGSSGKDFRDGSVGGFGKAKEILYFAHESYTIDSGDWKLSGSGAGYDIEPRSACLLGTRSAVTWKGLQADALRNAFRRFIELCGRRGCEFVLDGESLRPTIGKFQCDRPLVHEGEQWAHLGDQKFEGHLLVVRVAGLPMFHEHTNYKRTLVLELQGDSGKRLTANRDSLKYPHSTHLSELLTQLTVDRRSALTLEKPTYTRFEGPKLQVVRPPTDDERAEAERAARYAKLAATDPAPPPDPGGGIRVEVQGRREAPVNILPHEFILKNCVRRAMPREFDPDDVKFSDHAHWLVKAWSGCLLELHALYEFDHKFSIGFVLSEDVVAEAEKSSKYGRVYFLNPCLVGRKAITRRWKKSNRGGILATAAHEFVHGALDHKYHNEDYAGTLTDVMGSILNHERRFNRHFS